MERKQQKQANKMWRQPHRSDLGGVLAIINEANIIMRLGILYQHHHGL